MYTLLPAPLPPRKLHTIEKAFRGLLHNAELLLYYCQKAEEFYRRLKTEDLQNARLKEARESKNATISGGMLTRLAFIFIPLNFTTSFFGMNVSLFGSGDLKIWIFFATAGVIGFLASLPLLAGTFDALLEKYEDFTFFSKARLRWTRRGTAGGLVNDNKGVSFWNRG